MSDHDNRQHSAIALSDRTEREVVVHASKITKRFLGKRETVDAVSDLTVDVHAGEFVCLVGPSGCGKSTLLNMTAGLMSPTNGVLRYRGAAVPMPNTKIGYITQKDNLLPWATVSDNIGLALKIRGVPKHERRGAVDGTIHMLGLDGFADSYPAQLSGGMRKRAMLGRTLIYKPEALLLDEPFGALDAQLKLVMQQELLRICQEAKITTVFVTHDIAEAITLADRVVVISKRPGRVKLDCPIDIARPRDVFGIRSHPRFGPLHDTLWQALGDEMLAGEDM